MGHRLGQRHAEPFVMGRQDEEIGGGVVLAQETSVDFSEMSDSIRQARVGDLVPDLIREFRVPPRANKIQSPVQIGQTGQSVE